MPDATVDVLNYREEGGSVDHIGGTLEFGSGAVELLSAADTVAAHSGGGQSSATPLAAMVNRVTTVAAGNDSVLLPVSQKGMRIQVKNADASNALAVFPNGTDTINGGSASASVSVAAGKTAIFTCYTAGAWDGPVALA